MEGARFKGAGVRPVQCAIGRGLGERPPETTSSDGRAGGLLRAGHTMDARLVEVVARSEQLERVSRQLPGQNESVR